jgi:carboxyl-terminal processing protease
MSIFKNKIKSALSKKAVIICVSVLSVAGLAFKPIDDYFEISKNIDVFVTLFREVNLFYVDEVKPGELMKTGIDAMLESLDPYTNFISESEIEDYRFMTTGEYGGIGASVKQMDGKIVIAETYEGFPAQKGGIRPGDIIIEVEGKSVKNKPSDDISKMLKGQSGTSVTLAVERPGESELKKFVLTREEIKVKNVPYFGMLENGTGFIKLTGFTDGAAKEVKDALIKLKSENKCSGLILDLRDNPGGLLHEAVEIVNLFTEKGVEVVFTRGKIKEWDKSYITQSAPTDLNIPLVVLVSKGSASASEIVSGALQDLDRAVVVGQRTYGKGLVQQTRPLNYGAQVKITVAKYYVPSGRCIQALNYANRKADGSVDKVPDSLITAFKTKGGRVVYDGAGINPDIKTEALAFNPLVETLVEGNYIFNYATTYCIKNKNIEPAGKFKLREDEYLEFVNFVESKKIEYTTKTETVFNDLKNKAERDGYYSDIKSEYEALKNKILSRKKDDLKLNKDAIIPWLEEEIAGRYYYQRGRMESTIKYDKEIKEALSIINDQKTRTEILTKIEKPNKPFNPKKKF